MVICYYNIWQTKHEKLRVSMMESSGPFILFWILWLLLSCWIAYESKLQPELPKNTLRLRGIKLYLGEHFDHVTDAYKFIKAYGWSRESKWRLPTLHTVIIVFFGLFYALIPGITRLTIGDDSDGLDKQKFITKKELFVEVGALFANFLLISSFIYAIEAQYNKNFDNYREWMLDLTMLLSKSTTNEDIDDEHYMPKKGRNFSKDIFLSLTRRANALGWLEIRSFLAAEGQLLFAEQELPTLWILLLMISLSIFLLYRVFFIDGNPLQSILFNGLTMLCIICLVSLIRIAITGYKFEAIQKMQEKLLGEQRFFMRCSHQFDAESSDDKIRKFTVTNTGNYRSNDETTKHGQDQGIELAKYIKNELVLAKEEGTNEQKELTDVQKGREEQKETKAVLQSDVDLAEHEEDEVKYNMENDINIDEHQPLLRTEKNIKQNKDILIDMQKNIKTFGFIDNMLFVVERKDIFPRLLK
eukprot:329356_1